MNRQIPERHRTTQGQPGLSHPVQRAGEIFVKRRSYTDCTTDVRTSELGYRWVKDYAANQSEFSGEPRMFFTVAPCKASPSPITCALRVQDHEVRYSRATKAAEKWTRPFHDEKKGFSLLLRM